MIRVPVPYASPHAESQHRNEWRGVAGWLILAGLVLVPQTLTAALDTTQPTASRSIALRIDPNTATHAELTLLPGIGPKLAEAIIVFREKSPHNPAFRNESDLDQVPRVGPSVLSRSRDLLRFPGHAHHPAESIP